jgi:uncharacterized coiled-coil DUF342 family protein
MFGSKSKKIKELLAEISFLDKSVSAYRKQTADAEAFVKDLENTNEELSKQLHAMSLELSNTKSELDNVLHELEMTNAERNKIYDEYQQGLTLFTGAQSLITAMETFLASKQKPVKKAKKRKR